MVFRDTQIGREKAPTRQTYDISLGKNLTNSLEKVTTVINPWGERGERNCAVKFGAKSSTVRSVYMEALHDRGGLAR